MTSGVVDDTTGAYPTAIVVGLVLTVIVVLVHARSMRAGGSREARTGRPGPMGRLAWIGHAVCVLVLGGTAFATVLAQGAMHGFPLLVHVGVGGALTAVLALLALTWARANRSAAERGFSRLTRTTFWSVLGLGFLTAGSMLASTFPLFGTEGLERLLDVHRWSGLGLFVVTALHVHLVRSTRR